MEYELVKWLHIVSSTLLFGTGIGSAYYLLFVSLDGDPRVVAVVARYVVRADWCFTATTIVLQPLSGFYLIHLAAYPIDSRWLAGSLLLYVLAVSCWLPVVGMQMKMRDLAQQAVAHEQPLPKVYWHYLAYWTVLGSIAFFAFLAIFGLMVIKPV
jgi:uncharacterized membrane protein